MFDSHDFLNGLEYFFESRAIYDYCKPTKVFQSKLVIFTKFFSFDIGHSLRSWLTLVKTIAVIVANKNRN
jgi:hypothetical protein